MTRTVFAPVGGKSLLRIQDNMALRDRRLLSRYLKVDIMHPKRVATKLLSLNLMSH